MFPTTSVAVTAKGKKKTAAVPSSSSESEGDISPYNSSSDYDFLFSGGENDKISHEEVEVSFSFKENDFVIVKVQGKTKNAFRLYVAKITYVHNDGYDGVFFKRVHGSNKFLDMPEEAFIKKNDGVLK